MTAKATDQAPTLAERLERAREAEVAPCQRAAGLETALTAAIDRRDFVEAAGLEAELIPAREAAGFARAVSGALAEQVAAIESDRRRDLVARDDAEKRAGAQEVLGQALEAERQAVGQVDQHLDEMYDAIKAAQAAFLAARAAETAAGHARRRQFQARVTAGDLEAMPTYISPPNHASALADREPLIRELLKWRR